MLEVDFHGSTGLGNKPIYAGWRRVADPLLLFSDRWTDIGEPSRNDSAARGAGVQVGRHDCEDGHGFCVTDPHVDCRGKLEAFLARHLAAKAN